MFQQLKNEDVKHILKDFAVAHGQFFRRVRRWRAVGRARGRKARVLRRARQAPRASGVAVCADQVQQEWEKLLPVLESMQT